MQALKVRRAHDYEEDVQFIIALLRDLIVIIDNLRLSAFLAGFKLAGFRG